MKKLIYILLALLLCTCLPVQAYEYFTIHFKDGTTSEAFYATDVESISYSKQDLDGMEHADWQVQEIQTTDSLYRIPLTDIAYLDFKDVDETVVKQDIERISDAVIPLYMQSSSISEIINFLPTISNTDGVEDVWTDNQTLFVKIRDWGTLTFLYPPRRTSSPNETFMARQKRQPLKRSIQDNNNNDARSLCIVNQMYNARQFDYDTELKDSLEKHCILWGLNTKRINVPTRDFYKNDIFDYDIVFLDTHGFYDNNGTHWLLTGEMVMHSISEYEAAQDIHTGAEELFGWPLFWKEKISSLKYGSPLDISFSWVKDSLDNGKWRADCYIAVSQNFIKSSNRNFNANRKTIVFNTACQSVKNDPGMATIFTKDKGAGCYLGYDETNTKGGQAGIHYIEYLLSGKSVESVYKQMWQDDFMCKLCKEDTIIDNQHIQPQLLSYTYGVKADTLRITYPQTRDVEEIKLDDDSTGYIFSGEIKTNNNSFYESKNGYALYVSESSDFITCEPLGDFKYDVSQNSKIIWSCSAVKLKPNTRYYYVVAFNDGYSYCYGEVKSFTTKEAGEEDTSDYEAYYVINDNTITFYCDNKYNQRNGNHKSKIYISNHMNEFGGVGYLSGQKKAIFDSSFVNFKPKSFAGWFCDCRELESVENLRYINTTNTTNLWAMFLGCSSLTSLDLSGFNTSNVTDMTGMFYDCSSLTSLDLSHFNTSNVTSMSSMFIRCSSLRTIYAGNWKKTFYYSMFSGCNNLVGGQGTKIGKNLYGYDNMGNPLYYYCVDEGGAAHIDGGKDWPGLFTAK